MSSRAHFITRPSPPAVRLPVELLCYIFLAYRDAESTRTAGCQTREDIPPWVPGVLHVCRTWRSAALSCATLWTELNFFNPEWTGKFLQLSRELRLDAYADFSRYSYRTRRYTPFSSSSAAQRILTSLQRIRHLVIRADDKVDIHRILLQYADAPAPLLETLVLDCMAYSMSMVEDFGAALFAGHTPCLRVLRVRNASFQPKLMSSVLCGLTELEISGAYSWRWFAKIQDFLSMLEASPQLEFLKLEYSLPSDLPGQDQSATAALDASHTITMPALRKLDIHDYYESACQLLGHIALPPSHSLHINLIFREPVDAPGRARVASLASQMRMDPDHAVHALRLTFRSTQIVLTGTRSHPAEHPERGAEVLRLTMKCPNMSWNEDELFASTVRGLPIGGARTLDVDLRHPMEQYAWQAFFRSVPLVTSALVSGALSTHEFLQALGANPTEAGDTAASPHNLVHLERLSLTGILADEEWCELLVDALTSRRKLGASLLRELRVVTMANMWLKCPNEFEWLTDPVSLVASDFSITQWKDSEVRPAVETVAVNWDQC